ncbi:MAG: hypothetical protein V4692_10540 [Bdellovibrionota bacterium]
MKSIALCTLVAVQFSLVACGGGGGSGGGTPGTPSKPDWASLSAEFVARAKADAGLDLKIVKIHTEQPGYIVVLDHSVGGYSAYFLGTYDSGENVADYLASYKRHGGWYVRLDQNSMTGIYTDSATGTVFEEVTSTTKDLAKLAALKQGVQLEVSAEALRAEFGLSERRSRQLARLAIKLAERSAKSMSDADYDGFVKEVLGASASEVSTAMQSAAIGNSQPMNALVDKAASVNGVGREHINQILSNLFAN